MADASPTDGVAHRFFTGSFFPELETALAHEVAGSRQAHGPFAPLAILVPNNLLRVYLSRLLADRAGGHANLRFQTLTDLARSLVPDDARPLPPLAEEWIVAGLIQDRVTPDSYFGPVRHGVGFQTALSSTFRDLKQAGLSPTDLRRASGSLNPAKSQQLADLYEAFQGELKRSGFSDEDDLLKRATASVGYPVSLLGCRLFIYGFYDFNHLQRQFIAKLVSSVPATVFMPYHPSEAFRYAEPTLRWFEEILRVEPEPFLETGDAEVPATLANLRSRLFIGRELDPSEPPDASGFAIVSAPGEAREVKEILREAVRRCESGDRSLLHSAVIARHADDYAEQLHDCGVSRGYAVHLHGGRSLLREPVAQAIRLLLKIVAGDFRRGVVLEFLSLAPLRIERLLPADLRPGFLPSVWGRITAEAGIVAGADSWTQRVKHWNEAQEKSSARALKKGEPPTPEFEQKRLAGRALGHFVRVLFASLSQLPNAEAKWSEFVGGIETTARRFLSSSDRLEAALGVIRRLTQLEAIRPLVSLQTFTQFVDKALFDARVSDSRFEEGGLFVGGIESCRGISWPMVIVPGLVESSFPRVVREDPILLDEERKRLNEAMATASGVTSAPGGEAGVRGADRIPRLPLKQAAHDEERLLFQLAVESARERLVLSYPRLDPSNGSARVPSIFLLHALEALRGGTVNFESLRQDPLHHALPLREIRLDDQAKPALDICEHDLHVLHKATQGGPTRLKPYLDRVSPSIARGLTCERRRWRSPVFTEFDGVFQSAEGKKALAKLWRGQPWPVTALERFARSPFEFFLSDVLGVEPMDDPEQLEAVSPQDLGNLWHDILRDVVKELCERQLWPTWKTERAQQVAILRDIANRHLTGFQQHGVTGYPILWEVACEKLVVDLEAWLQAEATDTYVPLHVEHRLSATKVLGVNILGRVDRIDRSQAGDKWRIYDYKTGGRTIPARTFDKGRALQIPVYLLALESQQKGKVEIIGGYYFYVTHRGRRKRVGWSREALREREKPLQAILRELTSCLREGRFFLTDNVPDTAGASLPMAAVEKLVEMKSGDPRWTRLRTVLDEDDAADEARESEGKQLSLLPEGESEL